jgi:hypothetical protein
MAMPLPVSGSITPEASPIMNTPPSTAERARKITGSEERKCSCAGWCAAYSDSSRGSSDRSVSTKASHRPLCPARRLACTSPQMLVMLPSTAFTPR